MCLFSLSCCCCVAWWWCWVIMTMMTLAHETWLCMSCACTTSEHPDIKCHNVDLRWEWYHHHHYPSLQTSSCLAWWVCPQDVYMCLVTSRCVQLHSSRGGECVGSPIQILHIHIILKHIAHIHVGGYPSPRKICCVVWWVCTHDVYMCLDTSPWCTSRRVLLHSSRGGECVGSR